MNYREQLETNAEANYQNFFSEELAKSKEDIFCNAYKINFYTSLHDYLTNKEDLDKGVCKALCKEGENVIDLLYDDFIDTDYSSINTWDDIDDFISLCTEYDKSDMEM